MFSALRGLRSSSGLNSASGDGSPSKGHGRPSRVLVTGAGGQTGAIVVRKLLELGVGEGKTFSCVRAMVRTEESADKLSKKLGDVQGAEIVLGDVTDPVSLGAAFKGADAVIVCTSAMPTISKLSLARVIAIKLLSFSHVSAKPSFWFEAGQSPEHVDWLGQKAQFEAAQEAGVKHVVLVSSMCGTLPDHFLNTNMENIVLWKRKAECALVNSSLPYTIIHPGGLLPHFGSNDKAEGKKRQLHVAIDDELQLQEDNDKRTIPREDLAEVCVRCVLEPDVSVGRAFDLGSGPEGAGEAFEGKPGQLKALLDTLEGRNCNYTDKDAAFDKLETKNSRGCTCY